MYLGDDWLVLKYLFNYNKKLFAWIRCVVCCFILEIPKKYPLPIIKTDICNLTTT